MGGSTSVIRFSFVVVPVLGATGGAVMSWRACRIAAVTVVVFLACASASTAEAQRLSDEDFQAAVQQLGADSPDDRIAAVDILGRRGWRRRREISPRLRTMLRADADWRVRASSGRAIGRLSVRDAVPDLVRALGDPQVEVRVVAAAALWRLPDPTAVPALLELLEDDDDSARQWAALALGVIRDARAVEPLSRHLTDSAESVRTDAIRSLGRIANAAALPALRTFISDTDHPIDERLEAINSLASLDGPAKVNVLVRLLNDDERRVRLRVVRSLGQVGDALVIPGLRRRRGAERDNEMRAAIDEALEAIQTRARERREREASGGE